MGRFTRNWGGSLIAIALSAAFAFAPGASFAECDELTAGPSTVAMLSADVADAFDLSDCLGDVAAHTLNGGKAALIYGVLGGLFAKTLAGVMLGPVGVAVTAWHVYASGSDLVAMYNAETWEDFCAAGGEFIGGIAAAGMGGRMGMRAFQGRARAGDAARRLRGRAGSGLGEPTARQVRAMKQGGDVYEAVLGDFTGLLLPSGESL